MIVHFSAIKVSVDIKELVDDFVIFYIAGQETTSNLLTFAFVLTLLHLKSWRGNFHINSIHTSDTCIILVHTCRVQSEVDEVLGIKGCQY